MYACMHYRVTLLYCSLYCEAFEIFMVLNHLSLVETESQWGQWVSLNEHRNQSWWLQRAVLLTSLSVIHQHILLQVSHISQLACHKVLANKSTSELLCSPLKLGNETFPEVWKSRLFSLKLYLATTPLLSLFHCVRSGKGFLASLTSFV